MLEIPPVEQRLPLRPVDRVIDTPLPELTDEQKAMRQAAETRMAEFVRLRDAMRAERQAQIDEWEAGNVAIAADIRTRYDAEGE